jgi:type VI protein secretion system component VasF
MQYRQHPPHSGTLGGRRTDMALSYLRISHTPPFATTPMTDAQAERLDEGSLAIENHYHPERSAAEAALLNALPESAHPLFLAYERVRAHAAQEMVAAAWHAGQREAEHRERYAARSAAEMEAAGIAGEW